MKLSMQSLARKLSLPSPTKRDAAAGGDGGKKNKKRSLSRGETPSFASSTSSSSDDALARSSTPRSVLPPPAAPLEIPRRELEAVLRRLGHAEPSDAELDAVAALAAQPPPADGDGDDLMEAFRVFDADGDGRITAEELRAVLEGILGGGPDACSLDDCRRMIGGVDADGDGFVGFQDFTRMMMTATADARTFL